MQHPVPALGVTLHRHDLPGGLTHLHLACADEHRACVVAFRTPPHDSTGLPHILEHTTLCGSRRYPVRDPFFMMLRRSLASFMNAMTFGDMTAYPFATQVAKDWDNLLGVYLDAVFAPRLDERDFHQEGHRLAPDGTGWKRQGVVFNEMQGALDNTDAQVSGALARTLLPDTIYRHESGGEPVEIPRLTHADLVAFHRRCYCPANGLIVTYGDVDVPALHATLTPYLADAGKSLPPPSAQPPIASAQRIAIPVPIGAGQQAVDVTEAGVAWCWGDAARIDEVLEADLVERVLLGHAGAPLRLALESSGLGRGLGSSGYAGWQRNGLFTVALDGLEPEDQSAVEPLVMATLEDIARTGVSPEEIAAALHQLEFARREIRGDGHPYGLELCLRLVSPWNLGADGLPFLDPTAALEQLRQRASQPGWIQMQVRSRLLDNPHRVAFTTSPDADFHERQRTRVSELDQAELAEPGAESRLRAQAAALAERQAQPDDAGLLPDLALADVPATRRWASGVAATWPGGRLTVFSAPTNGILNLVAAVPLDLDGELELLPLLSSALGGLGCAGRSYTEQSALLNACSGGVRAWVETGSDPDDPAVVRPWFVVEMKALAERASQALPLLSETLLATRFDEATRLRELVEQALSSLQERVTRSGSALASSAAQRDFAGAAGLAHRTGGLGRLAWLKHTAAAITEDAPGGAAALADLGRRIERLRNRVALAAPQAALIGDAAGRPDILAAAHWPTRPSGEPVRRQLAARSPSPATAFTTGTAVNHHALCFPGPALRHSDAAALAVGMRILTNRWLHPRLREKGGAYGGGAGYGAGAISLSSYRDPRLGETHRDMRDGLRWLHELPDDAAALKEAQLGVLQSLDAPGSPAGEARRRFLGDLTGRDPATIEVFRARILATRCVEVREAAARWLPADGGTMASVTSPDGAKQLGWAAQEI
jgi:Zn-dependent M16 (insulinase) family peptidase